MAPGKIGFTIWLILVTCLWTLHPLLFVYTRWVVVLAALTGALAVAGWLSSQPAAVFWSGLVGTTNLTVAILLSDQPPNIWIGLSAGLTLLALLDGSQRFAYIRHAQLEPGVLMTMVDTFVRLSLLSVLIGLVLGGLLVAFGTHFEGRSQMSMLTLVGAAIFAGAFVLFLLYSSRMSSD